MAIATLQSYEPFYFTKKNFEFEHQGDLCQKVEKVALSILLALPYLLLDLILLPLSFSAQLCSAPTSHNGERLQRLQAHPYQPGEHVDARNNKLFHEQAP